MHPFALSVNDTALRIKESLCLATSRFPSNLNRIRLRRNPSASGSAIGPAMAGLPAFAPNFCTFQLPKGVSVNPLTIPASMNLGVLVLTADVNAPRDTVKWQKFVFNTEAHPLKRFTTAAPTN